MYSGSLANIKSELDAGHPPIVFLNLGFAIYVQGHYVVLTGYDDKGVYVHSGLNRDLFLSYERLTQDWQKTGNWTLLVLPGDRQARNP